LGGGGRGGRELVPPEAEALYSYRKQTDADADVWYCAIAIIATYSYY